MNYSETTPKEFYDTQKIDRKDYETRAETFAAITIPYVIRKDGSDKGTPYDDKVSQSYNGRLVNTLKSKMGMALLPAASSSFRLVPDNDAFEQVIGSENQEAMNEIYKALSTRTNQINTEIERQAIRESLFMVILNMMIVGSIIVEKKKDAGIIMHPLKTIAVELDNQGVPLAMSFLETLAMLPEDLAGSVEEADEYELYTFMYLDEESKKWIVRQAIGEEDVGDEQTYSIEDLPYQYLGWTWSPGDSMHRPYVEDYFGDMTQLDKLSKVLTDGAVIASKSLIFVDQRGGRTRTKDVANSDNGDVMDGSADDVTAFQLSKNYDFQIPMEREANLKRELASAFLMNESATRDAERVTAQEIQFMAQELEESSLSGIYSMMATKWSKWIVRMVMKELGIKFDTVDPKIITGLDALGRSQEARKLDNYISRLANLEMIEYINKEALAQKYAGLEGLDVTGLLKTQKEVDAAREQARATQVEQEAAMQAGGQIGAQGGAAVVNNMAGAQE